MYIALILVRLITKLVLVDLRVLDFKILNMLKQTVSHILRSFGLAKAADNIRYSYMYIRMYTKNKDFKRKYPSVKLPDDYIMYESFQLDYFKYYIGSQEDAIDIITLVKPYINLNRINLLDWGCGPARIIRHLPGILGLDNAYFATDYNAKTINWCRNSFVDIEFVKNDLQPPLPYEDSFFDFIYGISVLTHLSKEYQYEWCVELNRILSRKGIICLTTAGEAFREKLTKDEITIFDSGEIVTRGNVTEGHRTYASFHPPLYMKNMFEACGLTILDHIPGKKVRKDFISQDKWLLKGNYTPTT